MAVLLSAARPPPAYERPVGFAPSPCDEFAFVVDTGFVAWFTTS
jgi:hypothetical protein